MRLQPLGQGNLFEQFLRLKAMLEAEGCFDPARKRALLLHFGTASKVRAAALEDLQRAPGVSATVARKVYDFYHAGG